MTMTCETGHQLIAFFGTECPLCLSNLERDHFQNELSKLEQSVFYYIQEEPLETQVDKTAEAVSRASSYTPLADGQIQSQRETGR
jgi:hypothetical protein